MLGALNRVTLVGKITRVRSFDRLTIATLAVSRSYKDRSGEWKREAAYIPILLRWENQIKAAQEGKLALVDGYLVAKSTKKDDGSWKEFWGVQAQQFTIMGNAGREDNDVDNHAAAGVDSAEPGESGDDVPF